MFGLVLLVSMVNSVFSATITYTAKYGTKNYLLLLFLVILFIVWFLIYKTTKPIELNKDDILGSLTNLIIKAFSFIWFISIIMIFQAVLFVSSSETFLTDKLDLIYGLAILTAIVFGIVGVFNSIKLYNRMTGHTKFFKEFVYEIKTGGRK